MNYFIDVAASAQRDLADTFDYIDLTLKNPSAADKLVAIAWKKLISFLFGNPAHSSSKLSRIL